MRALSQSAHVLRARSCAPSTSTCIQYNRTPAYRQLSQLQHRFRIDASTQSSAAALQRPLRPSIALRSPFDSLASLPPTSLSARHFHHQTRLYQQPKPKEDIDDSPRQAGYDSFKSSTEQEPQRTPPESEASSEQRSESSARNEQEQPEGERENAEEEQQKEKKDEPPPPPHGDKSPWQVFTDTLKTEFKASKEWNESTKALGSAAHEFTQNETLKRARSAYGAASDVASTTTSKVLKTTGSAIGQSAAWTWDTAPVRGLRAGASAAGRGLEKATRPVRNTEAYKSVRDVIDDGSSRRYGGWVDKEERKRYREERELKDAAAGRRKPMEPMVEDPDAGRNVTLHKDAAWKESWRAFRDNNRVMQSLFSLKSTYAESENPLISTARSISDRVAGFFAENETAMVIKKFREIDPSFQLEPFLQDMREYILPEVLDAYVKGDVDILKSWLSEAQFQVYSALMKQYTTAGLKSDGRILDIRAVDVLSARLLDPGEIPVFILTCRTQEVHVFRNTKTGELAAGMEDRVQQVTYAIGVTRIPEDVSNPETRGWRLIELQKSARDYM